MNEWHEFEERVHDELELLHDEISAIAPLTRKLHQTDPEWRRCKTLFHRLEQVHEEFRAAIERFLKSHEPTEDTPE